MQYFNIQEPEELLLGKMEYEKRFNESEKISLSEFPSKINMSNDIFVYQDKTNNIYVIPYSIKSDIVYYANNKDNPQNVLVEFKNYIIKRNNLNLKQVKNIDILNIDFSDKFYLIKDKLIYIWD